ncbi:acyl-CoA dehydrogenase family protein [Streptomyces litchfieldiae]|uniref:Acyl-CoA dehydrogenase family protein n=1 Tax=Streptomyces litchfieldiae TaxID=3075543 RepID=A0ABU2MYZ9_9ACTN|nr:acyl-CoA dehydrogenase family protein [Streptomyces sp. DSM 44938]MDT0346881.1 acyl-CoA dehydrogenase family protein [Streptomyces sp. DSM 44938]
MPGRDSDVLLRTQISPALLTRLYESAERTAATGEPDHEVLAELRESGVLATAVPVEYGGAGGDARTVNAVVEKLALVNPSVAIIAFQHFAVSARIAEWGSERQKKTLLPALADGSLLAASAWSETGAGAAKRKLSSTAVRRDDGAWVLDGAKSFTTGASVADIYLVLVQTEEPAEVTDSVYGSTGQTFFLVSADNPGLVPDLSLDLVGMRGSATGFVSLRSCVVTDDDRLGPEGRAPEIIAGVRESGATLGAVSMGVARAAFQLAAGHLEKRGLFGKPEVRHRMVGLATRIESAAAIVERAGARTAANPGLTTLHSKLHASGVAEDICLDVARMLGSAGYVTASRLNRLLADARAVGLMGPTNDLCRELVAATWPK